MVRSLIVMVLVAGLSLAAAQDSEPGSVAAAASGRALSGAVHDTAGQPVVGAWLEVRAMTSGATTAEMFEGAPWKAMRSGADGRWSFAGLTEGTWLLTAVASTEADTAALTDEQLQAMAKPGADGRLPAGVALTQILRHFEAGQDAETEFMDLGLALGPRPEPSLVGQLVGAFDPDKLGYEVRLVRSTMHAGGMSASFSMSSGGGSGTVVETSTSTNGTTGETTTSTSTVTTVDGVSDPPDPSFTVVPDRDGRFDFGSLAAKDFDWVSVQAVPLADGSGAVGGEAFSGILAMLGPWTEGVAIPVSAQRSVTMKAVMADGQPPELATEDPTGIWCDVWSEGGRGSGHALDESGTQVVLGAGTYIARATLGEMASPLVAFTVDAGGGSPDISLVLQPCPPFTVHLVDALGAPLGKYFMELGTEATRGFPEPCRVSAMCKAGEATLEGLLPGTYDVQFSNFGKSPPFTQTLELKADGVPVVVTVP